MKTKLVSLSIIFLTLGIMPAVADTAKTMAEENYQNAYELEQSKANRLLTSASTAATGIGTMELLQGLSEQKADKAADADMNTYISTMRCSYGNGKSIKASADEIELPGGNDSNMMKYRSEYIALANDLKERKTALNMTPGIESEEILDKSQMGLYDDENVGITAGNYASRYRAQMLGSESDQAQLDEAAKTAKTRVIGGAVAAGAGVVGGIVGDELINQSLSSSTKTAQTCTESGGTWQGGRCHCPDGFIQHTKTGPCFEEKPTEVQTTASQQTPADPKNSTLPQDNSDNLSSDGNGGGSGETDDSSTVDIAAISSENTELEEEASPVPDGVVQYQEDICRNFDGNWQNGKCLCTEKFVYNNGYINCVSDTNASISAQEVRKTDEYNNTEPNISPVVSTGQSPQDQNISANTDVITAATVGTVAAATTQTTTVTVDASDSQNNNGNVQQTNEAKSNETLQKASNTGNKKEPEQKKVTDRPTSSPKATSNTQRANTTVSNKNSSNNKKNLKYIYGIFEDAQVTKSQAEQLIKLWSERQDIKGLSCEKETRTNTELVCSDSTTEYHFIFEDLTESFPRTQKKSIAMTVCKIFGGKKQTDLDTGLASRIHCEINTNVCTNQLNNALKRFGQKSYIHNVYSASGNGSTKTLSRSYCTIEW